MMTAIFFNNYNALMAVMAKLAARGRTPVIAIMSENTNNEQNGSNGHNDCDGDNSCNGDIGFFEIDDLNGFNRCNS